MSSNNDINNIVYFIDEKVCSGCGTCIHVGCESISWNCDKRRPSIDKKTCSGCGLCVKVCRFGAIKISC